MNRADDVIGARSVIAISHGLWQRRYGGSRDEIGRALTLRERRFTIVATRVDIATTDAPTTSSTASRAARVDPLTLLRAG